MKENAAGAATSPLPEKKKKMLGNMEETFMAKRKEERSIIISYC